jgi:hypothetical protein
MSRWPAWCQGGCESFTLGLASRTGTLAVEFQRTESSAMSSRARCLLPNALAFVGASDPRPRPGMSLPLSVVVDYPGEQRGYTQSPLRFEIQTVTRSNSGCRLFQMEPDANDGRNAAERRDEMTRHSVRQSGAPGHDSNSRFQQM